MNFYRSYSSLIEKKTFKKNLVKQRNDLSY